MLEGFKPGAGVIGCFYLGGKGRQVQFSFRVDVIVAVVTVFGEEGFNGRFEAIGAEGGEWVGGKSGGGEEGDEEQGCE